MKPLAYALVLLAAVTVPLVGTASAESGATPAHSTMACVPVGWSSNPPDAWWNPDCVGNRVS